MVNHDLNFNEFQLTNKLAYQDPQYLSSDAANQEFLPELLRCFLTILLGDRKSTTKISRKIKESCKP